MLTKEEKAIVEYGLKNGKTKEQTLDALANFRNKTPVRQTTQTAPQEPSFGERLAPEIEQRRTNVDTLLQDNADGKRGFLGSSVLVGGQIAGMGADIVEEGISTAAKKVWEVMPPWEKALLSGIGNVIKGGVKAIGSMPDTAIGGTGTVGDTFKNRAVEPVVEGYAELKERYPEVIRYVEAGGNMARLAGDFALVEGGLNVGKNVVQTGIGQAKQAAGGVQKLGTAITDTVRTELPVVAKQILPKPEDIMNRVARMTPKQAQSFEKMAGKTHGKYLQETGNFGNPQEIVTNEARKFANSIKEVDNALAELPGTFKSKNINTILADLVKREKAIGVASKETTRIKELANINKAQGLNMSEINETKRIYERTVKMGYLKEQNAIGIERSTRLDSALRNWQVETAGKLGLENLPALNKQTQVSKFIVDKLGGQLTGKTGNNAVTLTDWIILSGGDPTAIGAFFTKKLISSAGFQSKVAKALSSGKPVPPIKAQFNPGTSRTVPPPTVLPPDQLGISLPSTLPPKSPPVKPPNLSKGAVPQTALSKEASKYKSAEEFVKAQGMPLYHRTNATFDNFDISKKQGISQGIHFHSSLERSNAQGVIDRFGKNQIEAYTDAKLANLTGRGNDGLNYSHLPKDIQKVAKSPVKEWVTKLKEIGYEGYELGNEVVVFNPSQIKTKSQLTEIWKKAN